MSTDVALWLAIGAGVLAVLYGMFSVGWINKQPAGTAPLSQVANQEKMLPRDYITEDGMHITAKARRYLQPLIKGEDYPPYKDGLPLYVQLKNAPVRKKLAEPFVV